MQTLLEEYNKIYQKIRKLNQRILEYRGEITGIKSRRDDEIPVRIENLNNQLKKIDEYQLKIDAFIQLAEKHMTSKNVLTIEAPPGYRVNINRLRTWAMMIDPMAEDDPYAQRVYLVAKCDKLFLQNKKEEFTKKVEELTKDYEIGAPEEIKRLEKCIEDTQKEIRRYISGDEVSKFGENVIRENESMIYKDAPEKYTPPKELPEFWVPGAYGTVLDIEEADRKALKGSLDSYYDIVSSKVYLPIEKIRTDEEFAMLVNCVPARKCLNEMDKGIRNLLFQMIDRSPAGTRKVYIIDAVRMNSALVGSLKDIEGSFALKSVPRTQEQIQTTLEEIVSSFSDIDDLLENHDTVREYNSTVSVDKQIPRTVVVLVGWSKSFVDVNKEYVNRIISNYERYGVSFIAVNISAKKEKENETGISDYVGENLIHVKMDSRQTTIRFGQETEHSFSWYPFKQILYEDYCAEIKKIVEKTNGLGNEYVKRVEGFDSFPNYTRGKKDIELYYGVDSKDALHKLSFGNECFAAYLMGASGSGKSTLLHTLITGIIANYHPDDVELWLADFKMSEFSQYIDPMPPHIKYILLDESKELVYDLIDKLTDKMMERQRFFMKNRELKKVENVPPETHMPVIFVILDEFSIMSQAVNESQDYRIKLQNLLAKGRALGIKFIFSSQTFTSGIAGLTFTAKAQIQLRIAMKGSREEISETLELAPSQKTEQVQGWVDALPAHYALVKFREKDDQIIIRRVKVLYFKGTTDNAYQEQSTLIRKINDLVKPANTYSIANIGTYLEKNPVVVDGNSYEKFDKGYVKSCIKMTKKERAKDGLSDEILVAYGRPRLMNNIKLTGITPETRENILLLAPMSEQPYAASVILSVIQAFRLQDKDVEIWAYGRNKMYVAYRNLLKEHGRITEGTENISLAIKDVKDKVIKRESGDRLIVILGIERITGDFEFIGGAPATGSPVQKPVNPMALVQDEEQEFRARFALAWGDFKEKREAELQKEGMPWEKIAELIKEEKRKMADEWKPELEEIRKRKAEGITVSPTPGTKKAVETKATDEQIVGYNATEDLQYILTQGSRQGIHFLISMNN